MMTACVSPTTVFNSPAPGGEILPSRISDGIVISRPVMKEHHHLFPFKLYDMLEYAAADSEHSSVVSWVKGGRRFAIHNKDDFLKHIVPHFFKQTKYRSFTRQLNLWGFRRFSADGSVWGHKDFIRGQIERLGSIQRIESKSGKPKTESKPKKHPLPRTRKDKSTRRRVTKSDETAVPNESAYNVPSTIDVHENAPPQPLIPNRAFQPQQPAPIASHTPPVQLSNCSYPISPLNDSSHAEPHMYEHDGYTGRGTNEEDILFLMSGSFDSEDGSSNSSGEDLSSILNDFMNPVSLY